MTSARYRYFLAFNPVEKLTGVYLSRCCCSMAAADLTINADANLNALTKGLKP